MLHVIIKHEDARKYKTCILGPGCHRDSITPIGAKHEHNTWQRILLLPTLSNIFFFLNSRFESSSMLPSQSLSTLSSGTCLELQLVCTAQRLNLQVFASCLEKLNSLPANNIDTASGASTVLRIYRALSGWQISLWKVVKQLLPVDHEKKVISTVSSFHACAPDMSFISI